LVKSEKEAGHDESRSEKPGEITLVKSNFEGDAEGTLSAVNVEVESSSSNSGLFTNFRKMSTKASDEFAEEAAEVDLWSWRRVLQNLQYNPGGLSAADAPPRVPTEVTEDVAIRTSTEYAHADGSIEKENEETKGRKNFGNEGPRDGRRTQPKRGTKGGMRDDDSNDQE
jgi:hypothetical protein